MPLTDASVISIYIWDGGLMNDSIAGYFDSPTCEACMSGTSMVPHPTTRVIPAGITYLAVTYFILQYQT
jgi:hypothetical protein